MRGWGGNSSVGVRSEHWVIVMLKSWWRNCRLSPLDGETLEDVDGQCEFWRKLFTEVVDSHSPRKKAQVRRTILIKGVKIW